MKKALITGISGFSGGHLAAYLLNQGVAVYGIDLKPDLSPLHRHLRPRLQINRVDLLNSRAVQSLVKRLKPDYLFHLAALLRSNALEDFIRVNVFGTRNILEAAALVKAKVLLAGSSAEYGLVAKKDLPITENTPPHPVNYYGLSKLAQTLLGYQYFINRQAPVYLVRVFNMTGPGEPDRMVGGAFTTQLKDIKARQVKPIIYTGNLTSRRDFIDVRDVVRAYWSVIRQGRPGEIYNICSGRAYSIRQVLERLIKISQVGKITIKDSGRRSPFMDVPVQVGDNTRIKRETGWQPRITLEATLRAMLQ